MASALANTLRASAGSTRIFAASSQKFTKVSSPVVFRSGAARFPAAVRMGGVPVVGFHTSKKLGILPAGPQVIQGDINEPTPVPEPNPAHGSYHWSFERLIALSLVPLTIAPFAAGSLNPVTDAILGATVVIHSHIGFESMIIDYFPKRRLPGTHKFLRWTLRSATLAVLVGLYEFETNDVGITEAVKRIWKA